jgi:hypothetical protein
LTNVLKGSVVPTPRSDPKFEELAAEFGEEWVVWRPGRYVADPRRLDVSLTADSVDVLADKLRGFTELIKDLPHISRRDLPNESPASCA